MHVAATDDRHLYVRIRGGEPREPEYVRRFGVGSSPSDNVPPISEIRRYLNERRQELLSLLQSLSEPDLLTKPNEQAPWIYREWFQVLAWHEAHHHGQSHLTFNLYRATHAPALPKMGH